MRNLKFKDQLLIGFSVIIIFSLISNFIAVYELQNIKKGTELIIKHPFTVSNAVKDININITAIHRTMKDLALAKTNQEIEAAKVLVNHHDSLIHKAFRVVINRYLGDKKEVMDMYKDYNRWEIIRNEVIDLKIKGFDAEAIAITQGKGDAHVKLLIKETDGLINFALNKADEFNSSVKDKSNSVIEYIVIIMSFLLIISILSSIIISRSILTPIHHFIVQLGDIFNSKQSFITEKIKMDERYALNYTVTELKSAYNKIFEQNIKLNSFNAELEKRVNEKTYELQVQNEEYQSLNKIYLDQNERLSQLNDKLEEKRILFAETEKIGRVGGWEFNIDTHKQKWTDETYKIHELDTSFNPSIENGIDFYTLKSKPIIKKAIDQAIESGKPFDLELEIITAKGNLKNVHVIGKTDLTNSKVIGFIQDITDKKKIEIELKESERHLREANITKDKFFSIIAHDLKSPFIALLGLSEILMEKHSEYNNEKREYLIKSIYISADNAFKLIDNLLNWSRSQSDGLEFIPTNISLKTSLDETVKALDGQIKQKDINVIDTISDKTKIYADKNMLETTLRNLISNAIKFTPRGGEVKVNAEQNNDNMILTVSDNGIGMDRETLDNIFNISEKTSSYGTENETGTGLGLILCKEFIEKHGGDIWVDSELGQGSSFHVAIPFKLNGVLKNKPEIHDEYMI